MQRAWWRPMSGPPLAWAKTGPRSPCARAICLTHPPEADEVRAHEDGGSTIMGGLGRTQVKLSSGPCSTRRWLPWPFPELLMYLLFLSYPEASF